MGPLSLSNRICSKEPLTTTKTHLVLHRRPLQRCYSKGSKRNGSGDEVGANVVQNMMTFSLWLSASWRRDRTSSKTPTPGARPLIISPYSCIKCLFSLSYFPLFLSYFVTESFSSFPPKYISNLECHIGKRSTNLKSRVNFLNVLLLRTLWDDWGSDNFWRTVPSDLLFSWILSAKNCTSQKL